MFVRSPRFIRTSCALAVAATLGLPAAASAQDPQDILGSISEVTDTVHGTANGRSVAGSPGSGTPTTIRSAPDTASTVTMLEDGAVRELTTQQLELQQEDVKFDGYSLSPQTKAGEPGLPTVGKDTGAQLGETPLDDVDLAEEDAAKITWLLTQSKSASADRVVLDRLTSSVTDLTGVNSEQITPQQRAAGTQAAVWHFSQGMKLDPTRNDAAVTALYDYLTGPANTGVPVRRAAPLSQVPAVGELPTAEQLPAGLRSDAGRVAGPFEVDDAAPPLGLDVTGAKGAELVDPSGAPVSKAAPGEEFFLRLPEGATPQQTVVNTVSAPEDVTGRVMTDAGRATHEEPTRLVLSDGPALPVKQPVTLNWVAKPKAAATADQAPAATTVTATPFDCDDGSKAEQSDDCDAPEEVAESASDNGGLPLTGGALGGVLAAGAALLVGGGALFWFSRRRASVTQE